MSPAKITALLMYCLETLCLPSSHLWPTYGMPFLLLKLLTTNKVVAAMTALSWETLQLVSGAPLLVDNSTGVL